MKIKIRNSFKVDVSDAGEEGIKVPLVPFRR